MHSSMTCSLTFSNGIFSLNSWWKCFTFIMSFICLIAMYQPWAPEASWGNSVYTYGNGVMFLDRYNCWCHLSSCMYHLAMLPRLLFPTVIFLLNSWCCRTMSVHSDNLYVLVSSQIDFSLLIKMSHLEQYLNLCFSILQVFSLSKIASLASMI